MYTSSSAFAKSHKLLVRSSYAAECLAAAHTVDDCWPTLVTLHELASGILTPTQLRDLREKGGLSLWVFLTIDAESVYKSLSSEDLKITTGKSLLGHISWLREMLQLDILHGVRWCDTRDMTSDGHTKGSVDREPLLKVMKGIQQFVRDFKLYTPFRGASKSEY